MAPKVITTFVYPPIPARDHDWMAYYDGDEPNDAGGMDVGYGTTKEAAIHGLLTNWPREDDHA